MVNASGEDLEISLLGKEVELNVSHIELQKLKKTTRTWKSNFIVFICLWAGTSVIAAFIPPLIWLVYFDGIFSIISIIFWIVYANKTRAKQDEVDSKQNYVSYLKETLATAKPNDLPKAVPQTSEASKLTTSQNEAIDIKAKILKLNSLLEEGLITKEEYETSKMDLLKRI